MPVSNPLSPSTRALRLSPSLLLLACTLAACSGGAHGPDPEAAPAGAVVLHPDADPLAPTFFVAEDPSDGDAQRLELLEVRWGRLVEVYDEHGLSPVFSSFVVDDSIVGDGVDYALESDALTGVERLRILHPQDTPEFYDALVGLEVNQQHMLPKSVSTTELPPFTAVPRNAALLLRFNDLLDHETIDAQTVRLLTGYAPNTPFETRVFADPSHGNLAQGRFHSTRVIVDFTVSELEAAGSSLPLNALGLPAASGSSTPNAILRLPTRASAAQQQFDLLRSRSGRALSFDGNGPTDPLSPTLDVVRGFRSGGPSELTGDLHNGFLVDVAPPVLIGEQPVELLQTVNFQLGPLQQARLRFPVLACTFSPLAGDVLEFGSVRMQVAQASAQAPVNGVTGPFVVRALCSDCEPPVVVVNTTQPPVGSLLAPYRTPTGPVHADFSACFLQISPPPASPPAAGVANHATISLTFSEPVDPTSVRPFDTFVVSYDGGAPSTSPLYADVVGEIAPSQDSRRFTFQPRLPLRRSSPSGGERFEVSLSNSASRIRDLAGNELAPVLPDTAFSLAAGPTIDSAGLRLRFAGVDEDFDGAPELRGQFHFDPQREVIRARAVTRFAGLADRNTPSVGAMQDLPAANIQTPLSNNGSRLMRVWRYHDVGGLSLRDETTHNLDIEGLWFHPFGGVLQVDFFERFQMAFAHSRFLPDENLNAALLPMFPDSGLVRTFADNLADGAGEPLAIVHPAARGYALNPNDVSVSSSGDVIAPFPLNRGLTPDQFTYWTWRDTGKLAVGAPNGFGADTARLNTILGNAATNKGFYPVNKVPTIGLPLLAEFRTYPDSLASGQNGFRIAIALTSSARPFFRAFSTGGVHPTSGQTTTVFPDAETQANGGINPTTGASTPWGDNTFYYGQADFVVRVSRLHTAWFDSLGSATSYADAVIELGPTQTPAGSQLLVAYRGASGFSPTPVAPFAWSDARNFDAYGDLLTATQLVMTGNGSQALTPSFFPTPSDRSWKSSPSAIDGARFFQARVTFLANPLSGLAPELSALGFAFRR